MKKFIGTMLSVIMMCSIPFAVGSFAGCGGGNTLKVCNWEDYIDESLITEFETYYKAQTGNEIKVEYSTFSTNETLYTDMKINGSSYDLICPSDYMIEKMAREGMLEIISLGSDSIYKTNASPYIQDIFENKLTWGTNNASNLSQYATGYMWGTLGLLFNSADVDADDMNSWSSLWSNSYSNKFSIKDSVRDTYFISLAKLYKTELEEAKTKLNSGESTLAQYQATLTEIFNKTDDTTIASAQTVITDLGNRCKKWEVDDGKSDIVLGNIDINFAWSGDAVYSMDQADENNVELCYTIPEEGSNVWFDGWCVPKGSTQKDAAIMFMDFLSKPENAVKNMEYIGYSSCIAGDAVFENAVDWYGYAETISAEDYADLEDEDKAYYELSGEDYVLTTAAKDELNAVDLSYFFGTGDFIIYTDTLGRQFSAQYPDEEAVSRCVVMHYFEKSANDKINEMWMNVRA